MEDNSKGTSDPNSGNRFSMSDVTAEAGNKPRVDPSPPTELPQRYVVKDIGGKKS
jgi:hypothetical protein